MWFSQIVRSFFFTLDSTLFNLIPTVYDLLITISRTSILTQGQIKMFSDRIQALLGVFMLFKVTFSLITYIINPDDFSEKSKGFGKLWQNVIVTLIILILSPYAFSMAYDLQAMILDDNTLAGLVFGDNQEDYNYINTAGEKMAYTVMEPFFSPNTSLRANNLRANDEEEYDVITLDECTTLYEIDENGKKTFNSDCRDAMAKMMDDNTTSATSYLNNYIAGVENENLGLLFRLEMAKKTVVVNGDEEFLIDYMVPVSTVVVVIVLLILITFCLDVALRSVKLAFLQLISPIPIISYIDPKSGKDGMFKKWYQMCFSTYLSLFVRLLALYLAIYIIGLINSMTDVVTGAEVSNPWIKIFIIIGVLMFAKQLPKILEGFGIKLDGDGKFTLNPFKKMEDQALGGKKILGAGAAGLAGAAALGANGLTAFQNFKNSKGTGFWNRAKTATRGLGSVFAGGMSATARGLYGAAKGETFGKNFTNSYSGAMQAKQSRSDRIDDDVNWFEMMGSRVGQAIGKHSTTDAAKSASDHIKKINDAYSTMQAQAEAMDKGKFKVDEMMGNYAGANSKIDAFRGLKFEGIKDLKKFQEQATSERIERLAGESDQAFIKRQRDQQEYCNYIEDTIKTRLNGLAVGRYGTNSAETDRAIQDAFRTMQEEQKAFNAMIDSIDSDVGHITGTTADVINGTSKGAKARLSVSDVVQHDQKVQQYAAKKGQK